MAPYGILTLRRVFPTPVRGTEAAEIARRRGLGGTVGLHGDGGFTEAVYFASEKAAREGEQKEPPANMKEEFEQMMSLMQDVTYFDLPEPWLRSPR